MGIFDGDARGVFLFVFVDAMSLLRRENVECGDFGLTQFVPTMLFFTYPFSHIPLDLIVSPCYHVHKAMMKVLRAYMVTMFREPPFGARRAGHIGLLHLSSLELSTVSVRYSGFEAYIFS